MGHDFFLFLWLLPPFIQYFARTICSFHCKQNIFFAEVFYYLDISLSINFSSAANSFLDGTARASRITMKK